ncbi:MAG: hypothetical protein M1840_000541 [Geoglossum simile]|nr:MAG: hypothetical protein M1840_000541 [Geoglossum simile]
MLPSLPFAIYVIPPTQKPNYQFPADLQILATCPTPRLSIFKLSLPHRERVSRTNTNVIEMARIKQVARRSSGWSVRGSSYTDGFHIGKIRYEDLLRAGRYKLPPDVKKVVHRWMRAKNIVSRGSKRPLAGDFRDLCSNLGFLDPKYMENFRNLCILKLETFIGNEGRRLKGIAFIEDPTTGARTWAPWTAAWMEDDWDGETAPPTGSAPAQLPYNQQVETSQRLEDIVAHLRLLIPLLSTEEIERLLDSQFKLFRERAVSAHVARSITTWTEASLEECSARRENETLTEATRSVTEVIERTCEQRGAVGATNSRHNEATKGPLKKEPDDNGNNPATLPPPPKPTEPSSPLQPSFGFYGHFKTPQKL